MRDTMVSRGPDAGRSSLDRHAGLGHRRLSIIDLAGSVQPMSNEDGTVWISFNGEIYNFAELRRELIDRGHRFRTSRRHRDDRPPVRGIRRGLRHAPARDVRVRHLGRAHRHPFPGARPHRRQAALLRADRPGVPVRVRAQGHRRGPALPASDDRSTRRPCTATCRSCPCPIPSCIYRGVHKLPAAHTLTLREWHDRAQALLGRGVRRGRRASPRSGEKRSSRRCRSPSASASSRTCRSARS